MNRSTILTVTDLTRRIKSVLENDFVNVSVEGEISNYKRHSSGHMYFTLKDENAQLQAVLWRGRTSALFFTPQDGMKVVARGNITVYEVRGVYQIDVVHLQPLGAGELQLAFERLKQKLASQGYFTDEHKKPLPFFPQRIGIVTSSTGAALRDIITILSRRCPSVEVILYPVKVQGTGAAEEIAEAIRDFNEYGEIDVMIVGRGGGSLEDLWAFNEEIVADAIYASRIPVISAVGHEIDFSIADFVADLRAPTPSAAAELVVRTRNEMVDIVRNIHYNLRQIAGKTLSTYRDRIIAVLRSYSFNRPVDVVKQYSQRSDELRRSLHRAVMHRLTLAEHTVSSLQKRLASTNPRMILERGYVLVMKDGHIIGSSKRLQHDDAVELKFHDGTVPANIGS